MNNLKVTFNEEQNTICSYNSEIPKAEHIYINEEKNILNRYKDFDPKQKDKLTKQIIRKAFEYKEDILVLTEELYEKDKELEFYNSEQPLTNEKKKELNQALTIFDKQHKLEKSLEWHNKLSKSVEIKRAKMRNLLLNT